MNWRVRSSDKPACRSIIVPSPTGLIQEAVWHKRLAPLVGRWRLAHWRGHARGDSARHVAGVDLSPSCVPDDAGGTGHPVRVARALRGPGDWRARHSAGVRPGLLRDRRPHRHDGGPSVRPRSARGAQAGRPRIDADLSDGVGRRRVPAVAFHAERRPGVRSPIHSTDICP